MQLGGLGYGGGASGSKLSAALAASERLVSWASEWLL